MVHGLWIQSLIDLNSIISELNCSCYFLFLSYKNQTQACLDKKRFFLCSLESPRNVYVRKKNRYVSLASGTNGTRDSSITSICWSGLVSQTHFLCRLENKLLTGPVPERNCPFSLLVIIKKKKKRISRKYFDWPTQVTCQLQEIGSWREKNSTQNGVLPISEECHLNFSHPHPRAPVSHVQPPSFSATSPQQFSKHPNCCAFRPSFQHHQNLPTLYHILLGLSSLPFKEIAN